jgi:hypothetical protein
VIRLQVQAVYRKRSPGLYLAVRQRRRFEIADQVTGARREASAQAMPVYGVPVLYELRPTGSPAAFHSGNPSASRRAR